MKTPDKVSKLKLVATCESITIRKWEYYMEETKKADGHKIRKLIKNHLPDLYESLVLNFYNPYESNCVKKDGLLVYVHSSVEYFFKYEL